MEYREKILEVGENYSYEDGFNGKFGRYRISKIRDSFKLLAECGSVLEVGCGEGRITKVLTESFDRVVGVEPSERYCKKIEFADNLELHNLFFEDFHSDEKFDCVVATGVLEHVQNVPKFLFKAKHALKKDGLLILTVPNAGSLHRRIGLKMGLIGSLGELGSLDERVGHFRYYDWVSLMSDLNANGMTVVTLGGIFLKPLPFEKLGSLSGEYLEALFLLGNDFPELCAEIFAVAKRTF